MGTMALKYTPNIVNCPAYYNHSNTLVCFIFLKVLNACLQLLTTKQMISIRLEHQKNENEETDQFKDYEPRTMACECHRDEAKTS